MRERNAYSKHRMLSSPRARENIFGSHLFAAIFPASAIFGAYARVVRLGQRRFTVTAGAFVFDDEGRILLLEHEFRPDSRWGIPGGFLNKGEQPDDAMRRELREEVALEVDDVEFLFARTLPRPRQVEIYFACKTDERSHAEQFRNQKGRLVRDRRSCRTISRRISANDQTRARC